MPMQPIIHRTITITITETWPDESVGVEAPLLTAADDDRLDDQAAEPTEPDG